MGLFSNTSEMKKAVWLYEAHRCSSCGKLNASRQRLILRYRYDDIALSRSQTGRKAAAEAKLEKAAQELVKRAEDPSDIEKYYDLNLLGRCSCGHKEPWSRMRSGLFAPVFNSLVTMSVISLIVGVWQLFAAGNVILILIAAGLIALTVGMELTRRSLRKRREAAIAAPGQAYIPFLTADEAALREKFPELGEDKLTTVELSGFYTVQDD